MGRIIQQVMFRNNMSHETNTQLAEELEMLETDYKDDLNALTQANLDLNEAEKWRDKMIEKGRASREALDNFKERMKHD